jgi:hypothetical protein
LEFAPETVLGHIAEPPLAAANVLSPFITHGAGL